MTNSTEWRSPGARYELRIDGTPRTLRDDKDIAIKAAHFPMTHNPGAKITVTDLADGSDIKCQG
jgi:hypothetical protein